jgi:pyruvate dehydrogenase E2 component (dihydrolipoamide acetyltransferase)
MTDVVMPRLSDTMEEGTVLRWLKHDGEHVARGEELVEIETDKAAMTYESDSEGVLQTVAGEGDTLAVGELIARIGSADGNAEASTAGETPLQGSVKNTEPRVKASPLARRIAGETGVDLSTITGSGPGGRIVKADVEAPTEPPLAPMEVPTEPPLAPTPRAPATATQPAPTTPTETPHPIEPLAPATRSASPPLEGVASAKGDTTTLEPSRAQRTIARRMAESKATIPDFTLTADIDMESCVGLRGELKRLSHVDAPTYNDMIVKACALALREHPRANGSFRDGRFELHSRVNVGVAVAVASDNPTKGALVVPTVFDADTKALGEIARETRTLAERVRDGTVTPPELSGGTFTVSNLGMYGIASFTAIVNPPQAAILAVGAVKSRAVARDDQLVARHTMSVTLSCDHRILYGADAALFLARIRELLEEPAALTL